MIVPIYAKVSINFIGNYFMQTLDIHNLKANDIIRKCVHCGFCLATCPTYQLLGNELDSKSGKLLSKIRNARTCE
jgi:heterodisulfide reductase subunit C